MTATSRLDGDQLIATRHLTASPTDVWTAFTSVDGVAAFWGGSHATVPLASVDIDLRPGGEFSLETRAPDGGVRRLRFVYVSIAEPAELVFDEPLTGLRTTVTLRPDRGGTLLTVHQRPLPAALQSDQARAGLASVLDALADHLERVHPADRRSR